MKRREFIKGAAVGLAALSAASAKAKMPKYKVAVIGRTGKGNYGHGLDVVWNDIDQAQVVAVADVDPAGRAAAAKRLKAPSAYADYRDMLQKERPHLRQSAAAQSPQLREKLPPLILVVLPDAGQSFSDEAGREEKLRHSVVQLAGQATSLRGHGCLRRPLCQRLLRPLALSDLLP